jgi:prepilin-type processing-associated H-X9-DG protein
VAATFHHTKSKYRPDGSLIWTTWAELLKWFGNKGITGMALGKKQHGFTLIELLVVMTLMIIMYITLASSWSSSWQKKQKVICQKNLQTLYASLRLYAQEHDGAFPSIDGATTSEQPLELLIPQYSSRTDIFICPGTKDDPLPQAQPFGKNKISYAYYMGTHLDQGAGQPLVTDKQVDTGPKLGGKPAFSTDGKPPGNNHNKYGGNILFCDGHIESVSNSPTNELPVKPGITLLNPRP